jgi:predicted ArsR family transcriptional regulator
MSTSTNSNKSAPKTTPTLLALLVKLFEAKKASAKDLDTNAVYMGRLEKEGLVKVVGKVETGKRGRPAHIYAVTDKGRGRAKRAADKRQATEQVA